MFVSRKLKWITRTILLSVLVSAAVGIGLVRAQHLPDAPNTTHFSYAPIEGKGGEEVSGPYQVVMDWPQKITPGWTVTGVAIYVESPDRVYVAGRGEKRDVFKRNWGPETIRAMGKPPILLFNDKDNYKRGHTVCVYDRNGKLIESWDQWTAPDEKADSPGIPNVQRIQVNPYDPEHHIWITTGGPEIGGSILEFTHDGKTMVRKISAKDVPQEDPKNPWFVAEELAFLPNGDFYSAGGYQVIRFSKEGKYLSAFGKKGTAPGEFNYIGQSGGIHGVVPDLQRHRIYISDRVNARIEVFDDNWKLLDVWPNIPAPYCIRLTKDGRYLWVSDGFTMKFQKFDAMTGKHVPGSTWGTFGAAPGAFWGIHHFTTDSEGNLYTAEDYGGRAQKFVLRKDPGVNPEQVIGQLQ
jgi:hypothetical protein